MNLVFFNRPIIDNRSVGSNALSSASLDERHVNVPNTF